MLELALWILIAFGLALAAYIFLDLTCDNIAGAFRDALDALRDLFRP